MGAQPDLQLAGLVPFSSVDWPGKLVASVFAQGCPFRCPYCHNHEILDPRVPGVVEWSEVTDLLKRRGGLLDGVVFSGGEAMMQAAPPRTKQVLGGSGAPSGSGAPGVSGAPSSAGARQMQLQTSAADSALGRALADVRDLGFLTGLHAAGAYPKWLRQLLEADLVDWVGLDIKAMPQQYAYVTGSPVAGNKVEESLAALVDHPEVDYEVRLTLWPGLLRGPGVPFSADVVDPKAAGRQLLKYAQDVAEWSYRRGARRFALQKFQTRTVQEDAQGDNVPSAVWDTEEATFMLQQIGFDWVQVR